MDKIVIKVVSSSPTGETSRPLFERVLSSSKPLQIDAEFLRVVHSLFALPHKIMIICDEYE